MPDVSIILPNYNHAPFLKQRIDSILDQTFRDFELIILDDCSTDNSKAIIEEYRNQEKISNIVYNNSNSGSVFKQWQKGISFAKGTFVWIAESDDYADTRFLEVLVPILEANPDAGLVYANSKIIGDQGLVISETLSDRRNDYSKLQQWNQDYVLPGKQQLRESLSTWCSVNNASAVLFRKSALDTLEIDVTQYRYAGDWAVYVDLALKYDIAYVHIALSFYRDHISNASKKAYTSGLIFLDHFRVLNHYYKHLDLKGDKKEYEISNIGSILEAKSYVDAGKAIKIYVKMFSINPLFFTKVLFRWLHDKIFNS